MKSLKGIQTEKNVLTAFSGEFLARNWDNFLASQPSRRATSRSPPSWPRPPTNEKEHAKRLVKFLGGGEINERCPHEPPTPPRTTAPSA